MTRGHALAYRVVAAMRENGQAQQVIDAVLMRPAAPVYDDHGVAPVDLAQPEPAVLLRADRAGPPQAELPLTCRTLAR